MKPATRTTPASAIRPSTSASAHTGTGTGRSCDVLVVGGGINGAGIARDLAGRGLSVVLCEKDDLAQHTSSNSTKLIHGGLRYLEHFEFALVRKALAEREVLLKSAPHIIWPLRFVMPHDASGHSVRPVWMVRAGLFLYDHLARRELLPASTTIDLRGSIYGAPLQPRFRKAFVYSDAWVDDARLVVSNAIDARERGAQVWTRWRCADARRAASGWQVRLESTAGASRQVTARALVNAAGPWASQFLGELAHQSDAKSLRLVKGSHIVVRKRFDHDHAYILQNPDRRIVFVIPYEGDFTLIGTTDVDHHGAIGEATVDASEVVYLCEQVNRYLAAPVTPADVVWSYAGVRPLLEDESRDASTVTRDYQLDLDLNGAPLLTVWGGKLTTFRKLAEEAADLLQARLKLPLKLPLKAQLPAASKTARGAWTADAVLPGGDLAAAADPAGRQPADVVGSFARFEAALAQRFPAWPPALRHRLARCYGSRIELIVGRAPGAPDLGREVAPGLFEAELDYLREYEWACSADDVLWRRTKLGLHLTPAQRADVARWCESRWGGDGGGRSSAANGMRRIACN